MNSSNNMVKSYSAMSFACVFWGISFISTKICFQWFTPFSLAAVRFIIASVILFFVVKFKEKGVVVEKSDYTRLFFSGFIGVFLYFAFENIGVKYLSASLASILLSSIPAFAVVIDCLVLKMPLTKNKSASIVLSMLGVGLVVGFNAEPAGGNLVLGSILMVLSAISWVIYSYMSAPLRGKYSPTVISYYQNLFGALCFILFLPFNPIDLTGFTAVGFLNLFFLGAICSAGCYLLYNYAIGHISVMICSVFINTMPIITIAASMLILGEKITPIQVVGTILIISSVFLITQPEKAAK